MRLKLSALFLSHCSFLLFFSRGAVRGSCRFRQYMSNATTWTPDGMSRVASAFYCALSDLTDEGSCRVVGTDAFVDSKEVKSGTEVESAMPKVADMLPAQRVFSTDGSIAMKDHVWLAVGSIGFRSIAAICREFWRNGVLVFCECTGLAYYVCQGDSPRFLELSQCLRMLNERPHLPSLMVLEDGFHWASVYVPRCRAWTSWGYQSARVYDFLYVKDSVKDQQCAFFAIWRRCVYPVSCLYAGHRIVRQVLDGSNEIVQSVASVANTPSRTCRQHDRSDVTAPNKSRNGPSPITLFEDKKCFSSPYVHTRVSRRGGIFSDLAANTGRSLNFNGHPEARRRIKKK